MFLEPDVALKCHVYFELIKNTKIRRYMAGQSKQMNKKSFLSQALTVSSSEVGKGIITLLLHHDVLHHVDVVHKWSDAQAFHNHIRQVVWVQHQVLTAVLHQVFIISPFILPHCLHYITDTILVSVG